MPSSLSSRSGPGAGPTTHAGQPPAATDHPLARPSMRVAVAGTGGACAAAVAVWLLAVPLGGVELVDASGHDIGIVAVMLVSLLAGAAGFGLLALLTRRRDRSRTWTVIAGAVLAVSLLGPVSAATTAALLTMLCLHVLVGGIVISTGLLGVRRTR